MEYRELGRTGWRVSTIGFGAWAIGADAWGRTDDAQSRAALHVASGYNARELRAFAERSLRNLSVETLDLLQLHCPPGEVYDMPEVFGAPDELAAAGLVRHYGVSVERVDEALRAIENPGVQSVQIIFNMFRLKPAEEFLPAAAVRRVGVLARVPLASGLLSGRYRPDTRFAASDHRQYNRHGEAFDAGETFSGVDYETALAAVEELRPLVPPGAEPAQLALRWILMFPAVTTTIPGARTPEQAASNAAADLPPLPPEAMERVRAVYDRYFRGAVHARW